MNDGVNCCVAPPEPVYMLRMKELMERLERCEKIALNLHERVIGAGSPCDPMNGEAPACVLADMEQAITIAGNTQTALARLAEIF